jgi:hypothetical protein
LEDASGSTAQRLFLARLGRHDAPQRALVVASEHARELLPAEVVLHFIQQACAGMLPSLSSLADLGATHVRTGAGAELFEHMQYLLVPVMNPGGRELVLSGESPCQRLTPEGNDINRDGERDWSSETEGAGNKPLSTFQLRVLDQLAATSQLSVFVDLHTGPPTPGVPERALAHPWGARKRANPDETQQHQLLAQVRRLHCTDCGIGSSLAMNGYEQRGAVLDHMYSKHKIKNSFLWEIFGNASADGCVEQFNPSDGQLDTNLNTWAGALFTIGDFIWVGNKIEYPPDSRVSPQAVRRPLSNVNLEPLRRHRDHN